MSERLTSEFVQVGVGRTRGRSSDYPRIAVMNNHNGASIYLNRYVAHRLAPETVKMVITVQLFVSDKAIKIAPCAADAPGAYRLNLITGQLSAAPIIRLLQLPKGSRYECDVEFKNDGTEVWGHFPPELLSHVRTVQAAQEEADE